MRKIFKYSIELTERFSIVMYQDTEILCVQMQRGKPQLWAIVNPDAPACVRNFVIQGTGHILSIEQPHHYIGTFQTDEGKFVWHLFEII